MKNTLIFSLTKNTKLRDTLANKLSIESGNADIHLFPDKESYIRINSNVSNKTALLVCSLNNPDCKILPLLFMAKTLKELGANSVCLISPYLPYMRQDKRFHPGEAITSILFAQLLSSCIDSMITIDPHLHRIHQLSEIYTIPRLLTLHATQIIAAWIQGHIKDPILIGPDEESRQWVSDIADYANLPFVICQKQRLGDRQVNVSLPKINNINHVPVLVDDIISTGVSMLETLKQLISRGFKKPICIGVHALFDSETEHQLKDAGAERIITCNTIPHSTNAIDIADIIAKGIIELC